jgi:Asp-tRNA(Asn)/Glu-tRNA(Gln) amidotransferase A subunit family amidase
MKITVRNKLRAIWTAVPFVVLVLAPGLNAQQPGLFHLEEATIADIQNAIKSGQTTCQAVVQAYFNRAKAYNGTCTALVTKDGAPIPPATGIVRAGSPLKFPTATVPISSVFPDFDKYKGLPMELGRMEPTISDPSVQQQFGMRVGIPNAGQLNALETLNIRGERSVTCKGDFDRAPSKGPLPAGAPAVCEEFRKMPDALERAAELDKQYGRNPDLDKLPMYCVVMSLKDWYDAKDMRATGGNDINYAMDVPKADSPDIADLRAKGAIIYAVATAKATGVGGGNGAAANAASILPDGNMGYGVWGGQTCNPYDTERVPRGTSNGSGVSVAANLVTCSICEQTSASCKGPASRNNVVNLLATKGIMMDGGPGHSNPGDRAGIHCRTVGDAVRLLDAVKGFDSKDVYSAITPGIIPKEPYSSFLVSEQPSAAKPLQGMRIGVVREFMVKHTKNDVAISDQLDAEIKTILRDKLGAELVESVDPMYADDPAVLNMKYTFQDAIKEIFPAIVPEYFSQTTSTGELEFSVHGWDVKSMDYLIALAMGKAPLSPKLNLRRISSGGYSNTTAGFAMNEYLSERGDTRVKDEASLTANAKSERLAAPPGTPNTANARNGRGNQSSISYLKMQAVMRMVIQKVMSENHLDAFVNPEQTTPPYKLGGPGEPEINGRTAASCCMGFTALIGAPEIDVPAGYEQIVYEPQYVLSADRATYTEATGTIQTMLPNPMPLSLMFWAGPGNEPALIKAASAYESATHHRTSPKNFGPIPGEP